MDFHNSLALPNILALAVQTSAQIDNPVALAGHILSDWVPFLDSCACEDFGHIQLGAQNSTLTTLEAARVGGWPGSPLLSSFTPPDNSLEVSGLFKGDLNFLANQLCFIIPFKLSLAVSQPHMDGWVRLVMCKNKIYFSIVLFFILPVSKYQVLPVFLFSSSELLHN